MTITLVRISALIGRDISGLQADIRSRMANGDLMHDHQAENGPMMVTMKCAEYITSKSELPTLTKLYGKDKLRWMYWRWETSGSMFDCGYSGHCAEDDEHHKYYLMLETK